MNGNANLNANNLSSQNVIDWRNKLDVASKDLTNVTATRTSQMVTIPNIGAGVKYTGKHLCVESFRSTDNQFWYRKYDDGFKECGGVYNIPSMAGWVITRFDVYLPLEFSNTNYQFLTSILTDGGNTWNLRHAETTRSTNKVRLGYGHGDSYTTGTCKASYYCCGY